MDSSVIPPKGCPVCASTTVTEMGMPNPPDVLDTGGIRKYRKGINARMKLIQMNSLDFTS